MNTTEEIIELGRRWVAAEQTRDPTELDRLGAAEFRLVGPVGYVLDREQWLDRYRREAPLRLDDMQWTDVEVRNFGDTVIAIGVQTQRGSYADMSADGRFRVTQVYVREDTQWRLASLHYSTIGGPPPFPAPGPRDEETEA